MTEISNPHDAPDIVLLGDKPFDDLPRVHAIEAIPDGTRIVVVPWGRGDGEELLALLREEHPHIRIAVWVSEPSPELVEGCLAFGVDDVVVGEAHLRHSVARWRKDLDLLDADADRMEILDRLVGLIREIADEPELGDVLRIAVVRLAQLFRIERVSVVLFKPGDEVGFVVMENEESLLDNLVIRLADYPEIEQVIGSHEPLVISDTLGDVMLSGVRDKIEQAKTVPRAAVLFPLVRKQEVVGALFLRSDQPIEVLGDQLLDMGRLIASVTAVAIGSALEHDTLLSEQRALIRKKAEADEKVAGLQEFSEFFARAHDGIVFADAQGAIRYANQAAGAILGKEPSDLPGQRFTDLLSPRSHQLAERALNGDEVGDAYGYVDLLAPVGGESEVVVSAAVQSLDDPRGVLISFRDVTELREIETELRQTKEFLENLIQSSVDAIVSSDIEGRIILFNRAAEKFLGYSASDVVGKMNVVSLYADGEAKDIMRRLRSDAYGGRGRLEMTRKDLVARGGELVPVNLTASVIYEEDREVATVGIFTDLRERLKIEEKLSQVQRQLQFSERQSVAMELAGAAAHELNQPLTSILGYAEILKRRVDEDSPARKPVEVIARETERMARIVRKIGQITSYETTPYVGGSQILNLGETPDDGKDDDAP